MRVGHFLLLLVLAAIFVNSNTAAATPSIDRALRKSREAEELDQEERLPISNSVTGLTDKLKKVFATSEKKKLERAVKLVAKHADSREFANAKISPETMFKAMGLEASMGKYADWQKLSFKEQTNLFYNALGKADERLRINLNQWDGYELSWATKVYTRKHRD